MTTFKSDAFQGLCLASIDGAGSFFMSYYDNMTPAIRDAVRNSSFNICPACLLERALEIQEKTHVSREDSIFLALKEFEVTLRGNADGV